MKTLSPIIATCILSLIIGCGSDSKTTNTKSSIFKTNQEKIQFLEKYITFKRSYKKLDFHINYQDNSTGMVPGPSDWDICLVAVVPPFELEKWVIGLEKLKITPDKIWLSKIPTKINYSKITEWYQLSSDSVIGIDRNNNVVVYRNFKY